MSYREPAVQVVIAPTRHGILRAELAPNRVTLAVGAKSLELAGQSAVLVDSARRRRRRVYTLGGRVAIARDTSRGDFGIWIEVDPGSDRAGMRRIFGVDPVSLLDPRGLDALRALDPISRLLRAMLGTPRAAELGSPAAGGADKVLLFDTEDCLELYARRLFRDRARLVLAVEPAGRVLIPGRDPITVRSRFGVTVVGDYLRFADPEGVDLARVAVPWLSPEDRAELARRIGARVDHLPAT